MNVFVTGGAGFIGTHTCVELLNGGHNIVVADNFVNSTADALDRVKKITGKDFPFYELDICDETGLDAVFAKHSFDAVIHFAGLKAVGESVGIPVDYYANNLGSTTTLCRVMQKHNVTRIIFSSSATVYNGNNTMPLTETSATGGCTNPYGWTKYMCEQILRDAAAAYNWSVILLRYFNPIGAHESGLIGENPRGIPNNLFPYISQTAAGIRECLSVYGGDYDTVDGTGVRDYIHVVDLAKGHVAALAYSAKNNGETVFNLGTGNGTSVLQAVTAFEKVNNVTVAHKIVPRRAGDLGTCYADASKASVLLGWRAEKNIEDMCRDAWRWQTSQKSE